MENSQPESNKKRNNKLRLTGRHASSKSAGCLCIKINENDYWQQELRI